MNANVVFNMIKVNKIEVQTVEHFDSEGNSLGFLNEFENADLRAQIVEQKAEGYYLVFKDKKIAIETNGKLSDWPAGLYDTNELLIARIFKAQGFI